MLQIQPIAVTYTASSIEIAIKDYIIGAQEQEATVLYLDNREVVVKVEKVKVPVITRMNSDSSIVDFICKQLGIIIISQNDNLHPAPTNEHSTDNPASHH